jgi:hypothetical protein
VTLDKHDRATPGLRSRAAALVGLGLGLILAAGPAAGQEAGRLGAVLQGLDKTTARVSTIEAPLDQPARFGTLQIVARACHKKPPTETPESTAFLEIVDIRPDSPSIPVFTGWMFASSPAISSMEHPVYDVWVIDCRAIAPPEAGAETEASTGAEEAGETASPDLGEPQAE